MSTWTDYFDSDILQRGMEYFNRGKVKGYSQTEDSCIARVLGTRVYNVRVSGLKSGKLKFVCDCPYAAAGLHCKHEAALMQQWENMNDTPVWEDYEFESGKRKTFFNVQKIIEEVNISRDDIKEAQELIEDKKVKITKVQMHYTSTYGFKNSELIISFDGELQEKGTYPAQIRIAFSKERIVNADCFARHENRRTYWGYYGGYLNNFCAHEIALFLLADRYVARYNPGDETDYLGNMILSGYKQLASFQKIDENQEKAKIIRLVPRLSVGRSGAHSAFFLSFRIGIEKMYVLKSIPELIKAKDEFGALKLGKNSIISFMDYEFTEESEAYYELIKDAKSEADYLEEKFKSLVSYTVNVRSVLRDSMQLSPELLDKFYDIALGKTFELNGYMTSEKKELKQLSFSEGKIHCQVMIKNNKDGNGEFKGLSVEADIPKLFQGKKFNYTLDESAGTFSRIDALSPAMKLFIDNSFNSKTSFNIGKKKLPEFYYRFLPQLMEAPEIEVIEEHPNAIKKYLPPECELIFYMDADEDRIIGRVSARYDEKEIPLHILQDSDFPLPEDRDMDFEQSGIKMLQKYLPDTLGGEEFFCEKTGDNTFTILSEGIRDLMSVGEIRASRDFEKLKIRKAPVVRLGVSVESGILNLDVSSDEMSAEELLELLDSYRKNKKYFRLKNGEFIRLEKDDAIEELVATMQAMGVSVREFTKGKLHLPMYRAIYINKLLEEHDEIASDRDKNFKSLVRNFNSVKDADIEVPESLSRVLRGYQAYGFKWLEVLSELGFGGILADDMGLGKTLQIITLLLYRKEKSESDNNRNCSLIVCPASLVYNWEEEFRRFAPSMSVRTVTGTQAERKKLLKSKDLPDVLITSYDLLKRDIGTYSDLSFDYEIIDEAQFIKNQTAAASKAVKVINSAHRFALTGTPIENRLSELWSIFDYLMPGFLYTYDRFRSDFENAITKAKDEEVTRQLKNMVGPFILRRLKENVLKDLPDKIEEVRYSRFESEQQKLYDAQVTHMKKVLESEDYKSGKGRIKVFAELTRIRQICCDPSLMTDGFKGESAKRQSCMELIQSAIDGGHKILLFSQFTSMLALLEDDLKKEGIEYYKITGETSKEERIKLVHAFNENEVPLFLISLKAGGTGLNLVGADVVIHYDPWWNVAAQNQATDRAHRIGQTKTVSVFKLIAKGTIEEKILEMQNAKKDLADAILSGESESLMNMSKEQLLELIG